VINAKRKDARMPVASPGNCGNRSCTMTLGSLAGCILLSSSHVFQALIFRRVSSRSLKYSQPCLEHLMSERVVNTIHFIIYAEEASHMLHLVQLVEHLYAETNLV
jgi:hypothetical protein